MLTVSSYRHHHNHDHFIIIIIVSFDIIIARILNTVKRIAIQDVQFKPTKLTILVCSQVIRSKTEIVLKYYFFKIVCIILKHDRIFGRFQMTKVTI